MDRVVLARVSGLHPVEAKLNLSPVKDTYRAIPFRSVKIRSSVLEMFLVGWGARTCSLF